MRTRLGGLAAALVLALGACGSDGKAAAPTAPEAERTGGVDLAMVSARDTLPPPPAPAGALTVVLTHPGGPLDPGLDAAAAALAQRPDVHVTIAAAGEPTSTMSGFPVTATGATAAEAVTAALDGAPDTDLVVVAVVDGHGIGSSSPEADVADARGVPALVVGAGLGSQPDLAAATLQLLEVLDLELDRILSGDVHRLAVPSCEHGMLRGRLTTRPAASVPSDLRSDCAATTVPGPSEADAFAAGYATLAPVG